jgi:hypothetical protein
VPSQRSPARAALAIISAVDPCWTLNARFSIPGSRRSAISVDVEQISPISTLFQENAPVWMEPSVRNGRLFSLQLADVPMAIRRSISKKSVRTFRGHSFWVEGSPVSVNRYGQLPYRNWREAVRQASIHDATWGPTSLVNGMCSVRIRYFRRLDRAKDVDNILKAILDGLDGKAGGHLKATQRVLNDDRTIERVVSQRTDLNFHTHIDGRSLHRHELQALIAARRNEAAVFVQVDAAPDHMIGIAP